MAIGPRVSVQSSNAGHRSGVVGTQPFAQGSPSDLSLPVGLSATVLDLGQVFGGDNLVFSLAPSSDPLPTGLTLDAQAVISGTPTQAATRTIVLRATNADGFADSAFTLETYILAFMATLSGLTTNPDFGPSAQTGTVVTAVADGFNGPPSGASGFQWKTLESGPIGGATASSLVVDAAAYDGETLYCTISATGYPDTDTTGAVIRHVAPVAAGGLVDEVFDQQSGPQVIETSADFSGEALVYSVTGPAVSIGSQTGALIIDTSSSLPGAQIIVTASNSGGSADSAFFLTIESDAGTLETAPASSTVTVRGVTFTFDRPMPVGYYADTGEPFVQSSQAFAITSITPVATNSSGTWANGAMKFAGDGSDVVWDNIDSPPQGFDERISLTIQGVAGTVPYNASDNIDPGNSGNISIAQGESCTIIKSTRDGAGGGTNTIDEYVILTIQPHVPTAKALRPCATACDMFQHDEDDIDLSVLQSLTPPPGTASVADCLSWLSPNAAARMFPGWGGERQRRFEDSTTRNLPSVNQAYSGDYWAERTAALYKLHESGVSAADKLALAKKVYRIGADVAGNYLANSGADYGRGLGQWHGYHPFAYFAGFLVQSISILTAAKALNSNMADSIWMTSDRLGVNNQQYWPTGNLGGSNIFERVWDETGLNKPNWTSQTSGMHSPGIYKGIAWTAGAQELLPILLLQDSPEGRSGEEEWFLAKGGDGTFGISNDISAQIAIMDSWWTWSEGNFDSWERGLQYDHYYEDWRSELATPQWTSTPDPVETEIFSTGSGGGEIDWNANGKETATETITRRDIAYSLDNMQFTVVEGVERNDTVGGLIAGCAHYIKYRMVSASGVGGWSRCGMKRRNQDSAVYGVITSGLGSPAAAPPVFTTDPIIMLPTYPDHLEPSYWDDTSGDTYSKNITRLTVSLGYLTGYPIDPAADFAFQWQRNDGGWVDIAGATGQTYDIDPANDAGLDMRCVVTCANASGSTSATTLPITLPTSATAAAGVIIDTQFDGSYFYDWPDEFASSDTKDANLVWEPDSTIGTNPGALIADKDGQRPHLRIYPATPLTPGTLYNYEIELIEDYRDWSASGRLEIASLNGAIEYVNVPINAPGVQGPRRFTGTFTSHGSVTNLRVRLVNTSSLGGSTGGDVACTYLKIEEA